MPGKIKFKYKIEYLHVRVTWVDPCACDEAWVPEDEILEHDIATCVDVGYIYKKTRSKLWLFTSYSRDDKGLSVGGLQCIPAGCIKKIEVMK